MVIVIYFHLINKSVLVCLITQYPFVEFLILQLYLIKHISDKNVFIAIIFLSQSRPEFSTVLFAIPEILILLGLLVGGDTFLEVNTVLTN